MTNIAAPVWFVLNNNEYFFVEIELAPKSLQIIVLSIFERFLSVLKLAILSDAKLFFMSSTLLLLQNCYNCLVQSNNARIFRQKIMSLHKILATILWKKIQSRGRNKKQNTVSLNHRNLVDRD